MNELLAFVYDTENQAETVKGVLSSFEQSGVVEIQDAVAVSRQPDGKVNVDESTSTAGLGAAAGGLLGIAIGFAVAVPFTGGAALPFLVGLAGAGAGAIGGNAVDLGIDERFSRECGQALAPGHSMLFVAVAQTEADGLIEKLKDFGGRILRSPLADNYKVDLQRAVRSVEQGDEPGVVHNNTMPTSVVEVTAS